MRHGSPPPMASRMIPAARVHCSRSWKRAVLAWTRHISFFRPPLVRTSSRSAPKSGCVTTITSSRTRSVTSASTCPESITSNCRSWPTDGSKGYPRVYLLARELIAHTAGRIDLETIVDFTSAYQRITPLTIGEIWAVPIMLRLGLVEELRRLADGVVGARRSRAQARRLACPAVVDRGMGRRSAWCRSWTAAATRTDAWRRPSSSSCCSGCATSRPPPPGSLRRCIARSRRRTIRLRRCCGSSISARRPTSWRSAT